MKMTTTTETMHANQLAVTPFKVARLTKLTSYWQPQLATISGYPICFYEDEFLRTAALKIS